MRPSVSFLTKDNILKIIDQAIEILEKQGVFVENQTALDIFSAGGARTGGGLQTVKLKRNLIENCLKSAPASFKLYNTSGQETHCLEKDNVHFVPGSSALYFIDGKTDEYRKPVTSDYVSYAKIVSQLDFIAAQSTAFIPSDVPDKMADSYRLFLSLLYCSKAVVTGIFTPPSFAVMRDMLITVSGSEAGLKEKPVSIFSCCPTSPFKWSDVTAQNLIDCARLSIPVEIIAMPLSAFSAPVTLTGTLVQHTAEILSGIVLAQLVNPGTPLLFGGSPAIFDVRFQSTPMGAMETMMIDCAYNEIGKYLNIPTQAYIALSDAKQLDAQAGLESGIGATLAALSGINSISGPGMMDFENCFSLEKLIVDNEICRMIFTMLEGIRPHAEDSLWPVFEELARDGHLLASEHTMEYLHSEHRYPGPVLERGNRGRWEKEGSLTMCQRATREANKLISAYGQFPLSKEKQTELIRIMKTEAKIHGLGHLPAHELIS